MCVHMGLKVVDMVVVVDFGYGFHGFWRWWLILVVCYMDFGCCGDGG